MTQILEERWEMRRYLTGVVAASVNEVLLQGEPSIELDTGFGKIGDGVSHYNDILYSWIGNVDLSAYAAGDVLTAVVTAGKLTWKVANVGSNQQAVAPYRADISGAVSIDLAAAKSNNLHLRLTGNVTSFALTNPLDGGVYNIRFIQDSTGGRTFAGLPAAFKFVSGTAPTFSSAANAVDFLSAEYGGTEGTYVASFMKGVS